jgi:hypothetical protein
VPTTRSIAKRGYCIARVEAAASSEVMAAAKMCNTEVSNIPRVPVRKKRFICRISEVLRMNSIIKVQRKKGEDAPVKKDLTKTI